MKNKSSLLSKAVLLGLAVLLLLGCSTLTPKSHARTEIKNAIMIIGDGMGPQQVDLLLSYARQAPHGILREHRHFADLSRRCIGH
ncbi:hypothetical protein [Methylomicrobium sp. Wu6]|uniref:hypothetical protein n=1 Tax=Methylomicrobium sp. Wu6 TaxID=3107928 RepID=UPI002DD6B298|nr:hypothetical protein [Methylomicrobium sp. Wu6]MEC4747098.1 hypothetical protein [Methylomicrobium sp. Wu6]